MAIQHSMPAINACRLLFELHGGVGKAFATGSAMVDVFPAISSQLDIHSHVCWGIGLAFENVIICANYLM